MWSSSVAVEINRVKQTILCGPPALLRETERERYMVKQRKVCGPPALLQRERYMIKQTKVCGTPALLQIERELHG